MVVRILKWSAIIVGAALILIQFVPYGHDHSNPDATQAVEWDSPRTAELFNHACADCHSNATDWPWYSKLAPVSWLVQSDVEDGRRAFNVSTPDGSDEGGDAGKAVKNGSMPPAQYKILHSDSRLSDQEREQLVAGLSATFGSEGHDNDQDSD